VGGSKRSWGRRPLALPLLPPAFQLVALDREVDAFERAVRLAPRGLDDGTVYWTDRADRLALAVALEPEAPTGATLEAVYVLAVAVGDALGALLPPQLPLAFAWPGGIVLDGAELGRVRAAVAPTLDAGEAPPWLVLGLDLAVGDRPGEPGTRPSLTSLSESGAGGEEVTAARLAEGVARHFLAWTHRWLEEGPAPVRAAWDARCFRKGEAATLGLAGGRFSGEVGGLDRAGRFRIGGAALPLESALAELG
jgi:BirA family transcriptional regulator, biotin operon repressor / biotin---[acetyl-CoA-carboxylase] ligase